MFASREMLGAFFQILFKASLPFGTIHVDSRTYGTYEYTGYAQKSCGLIVSVVICPKYFLPALLYCCYCCVTFFFSLMLRGPHLYL